MDCSQKIEATQWDGHGHEALPKSDGIKFRTHLDHGLKLHRPKKTVLCYDIDGSWNFHNPWPSAVDSIGDVPMRSAKVCSNRTKNNIRELCKMKLELHGAIKTERLHIGIILNKSNILSRFSQRAFSLTALKWGGNRTIMQ